LIDRIWGRVGSIRNALQLLEQIDNSGAAFTVAQQAGMSCLQQPGAGLDPLQIP
jgi:hypothetical protein